MINDKRIVRQLRAIRRYAKSLRSSLDSACENWVNKGCAKRWAEQN